MLEVDRVAPRLKIIKAGSDGKEWRAHMDQTKSSMKRLKKAYQIQEANLKDCLKMFLELLKRLERKNKY